VGWFYQWFGTPYYKLLYQNRNSQEAHAFIDKLVDFLHLQDGKRIVDVGCGQGRHAIYLSQKGFDVVGLDVVAENIEEASKSENEHLHFEQQDMRQPFHACSFDVAVNLFTSFGYFETEEEDIATLKNIHDCLNPNGIFVQDFMNAGCILKGQLIHNQHVERHGINFCINKYVEEKEVIKDIEVTDKGKQMHFQERVKLLTLKDFEKYYEKTGFRLKHVFGNYRLEPFEPKTADRLIMISERV
jgi:SAM-dependent methyltransferase